MIFVDTNYFLRFLVKEDILQHRKAVKLFESAAKGNIKLFTSIVVFFEIYWVLTSFYKKEKAHVAELLREILRMNFIKYESGELLVQAVAIFQKTNLDLEDAYNLLYAKKLKAKKFLTFDKKLWVNF